MNLKDICNGRERQPSLLQFINGTDETDCEDFWCLSLRSARCNGYWDCADGRDELNCSLDSLPTFAKSTKLLHTLNNCGIMEHFCLHVSNRSGISSHSCMPLSYAADGRIDCWGASDERHTICDYGNSFITTRRVYRCAGENNRCIQLREICNGYSYCPLGDDEKLCNWLPTGATGELFYCRNGTTFYRNRVQCNGKLDCADGEDEWLCDLQIRGPTISTLLEGNFLLYPHNLANISVRSNDQICNHVTESSYVKSDCYCNRGISVTEFRSRRCLCPSSYSGERCENQRERISAILQVISPPLLQKDIAIKLILYLIDITSLEILAEEEVLHFPYVHSSYKHLVLLPSSRASQAFVRIEAYEVNMKRVIAYRTSWKFDLPFPFLPVRRLTVRLVVVDDENYSSRTRFTCHTCIHGHCLPYQNSDDVFCRCDDGWTGFACNESLVCASEAKSISSHRCLCPMNRHGIGCFAPNIAVCQCQNGATCISLDPRTGQSACLCSDTYFGQHCERQHASLTIKRFDKSQPEILPIMLIQFIEYNYMRYVYLEDTLLFERISTSRDLVIYHINHETLSPIVLCKVFYSSSIDDYTYYIVLQIPFLRFFYGFQPKHIQTQLETRQKCLHIRDMEIFKTPTNILAYPHIKRVKFYLRGCIDNITRCFHDEIYLCFCPVQDNQTATCIVYDHTREKCHTPSYCLNGGLCVENRRGGTVEFACLCPSCHYYGSLCQFSIGQQGLSLDALVGTEMRTGKSLFEQSILIKVSMTILACMITFGSIGNILCIITYAQKKSRETGCGYYLFAISIYNQLTLVVLGLRFAYLLVTQIVVWKNKDQSLILCQSLEYGLTLLPNLSDWLSACVSVERTFTVASGASFKKQVSISTAKRLCVVLLIVLPALTVPEILTRQLIEDPRFGRYTWCVTKFSSAKLQTFKSILSITHLLGPFLINLLSTGILIIFIARQKLNVRENNINQSFTTVLREQTAYYKQLIISPTLLLILALPRLIISLGSLCIDTSWRNYAFLAGYFISFMPIAATLFIFVLPAPVYRDELKSYLLRVRSRCIRN